MKFQSTSSGRPFRTKTLIKIYSLVQFLFWTGMFYCSASVNSSQRQILHFQLKWITLDLIKAWIITFHARQEVFIQILNTLIYIFVAKLVLYFNYWKLRMFTFFRSEWCSHEVLGGAHQCPGDTCLHVTKAPCQEDGVEVSWMLFNLCIKRIKVASIFITNFYCSISFMKVYFTFIFFWK